MDLILPPLKRIGVISTFDTKVAIFSTPKSMLKMRFFLGLISTFLPIKKMTSTVKLSYFGIILTCWNLPETLANFPMFNFPLVFGNLKYFSPFN